MGKHTTDISLNLIEFLIGLGDVLLYHTETEYPMSEKSFGSQAIDIVWFNEKHNSFPLFIFEIESTSNNSIANNPTKIFGKDSRTFEKPLFFFHIIIDGAENSEKYNDLIGMYGKYNYDIFKLNNGDIENLLLKIISQHRRIHNNIDLYSIVKLINNFEEIKLGINFEKFLKDVEELVHKDEFYHIGKVYVDIASSDKLFQEQYFKFLSRLFESKNWFCLSYESFSINITSEFINLGILYSNYREKFSEIDFTNQLIKAQKTQTFGKIEYLPGLNYDYDIFIHDYVPFYVTLTFFLFDGNLDAQKYILNIAFNIIRKLKIREDFIFEHHVSWGLLMSASKPEFLESFEELRSLVNSEKGILNTILYSPSFMNDHQVLPHSILTIVPNLNEYIKTLNEEFTHLNNDCDINEIAIKSLSENWKDKIEYNSNLGVDLTNFVIKSLI